jgi:hypothetical protein
MGSIFGGTMSEFSPAPFAGPVHDWLRSIRLAFVPGPMSSLLEAAASQLLESFRQLGHTVQETPDASTELILTTAPFLRPLNWRDALLFTARRRFGLSHTPTVLTLIHARRGEFQRSLEHVERMLQNPSPQPSELAFEGLAPSAFETLLEQGRRGGPILALERVLQAQAKSIRILLFIGEERPEEAYLFDLVGAHPRLLADDEAAFYRHLALRVVTVMSTGEVTAHQVVGEPISAQEWRSLETPRHMLAAARELGKRHFFTRMVRIADLVAVPSIGDAVADQYSEGCFATWEPRLAALISTITGSARPVDKDSISEEDLAVIVGVRPDGKGALVRHVEGRRNDPPSSEAVEMIALDQPLPKVTLGGEGIVYSLPVARSKLHGHRGVAAFHPDFVEYVPLDPPFYHYPVSCSTEAQARGISQAFARASCLLNPADRRQVAFTILPGHGVVIVEKWNAEKAPFQLIWEYMDAGYLEIEPAVPQGLFTYAPGADGRYHLQNESLQL